MYILLFILAFLNIIVVQAEQCNEYKTCGQCIGNTFKCVWCPDRNHKGPRCVSSILKSQTKSWCSHPLNPKTQPPYLKVNKEFRSKKPGQSTIQLKPQHIVVQGRPGDTVNFEMHYRPAEDYPIDIYYLFDNSFTMKDHKQKLVDQARDMRVELMKRSNNVRFGAGSFIEKLALPYASKEAGHKLNTFNNHVSLTEEIDKFVEIVQKVTSSANYDDPESGLDGLMQTMVCEKEIDWRNESRRMIIYLTDATYHSAGDGKIVGAYKPNDMKCHLVRTPEDKYTSHTYELEASLTYDYPSVSQINKVATEGKFSVYFTTLQTVSREYTELAKSIKEAHYFKLKDITNKSTKEDGSNLIEFISDEYQKLVRTLVISQDGPSYVKTTLYPNCSPEKQCTIGYNETLTIRGEIYIQSCPNEEDESKNTITIKPTRIQDSLKIELEALCQCECEKDGQGEVNSESCSKNGTYQCGVCKCNKNRYGEKCECEGTSTTERDHKLCKSSANDTSVCSGRGNCLCGGKCECLTGYDGDHCQYRMDECPTFENMVCANQGKCVENKCKCNPGWSGTDCTCSTEESTCIGANSKVCSGNGNCKCGSCECTKFDKSNNLYGGKYCHLCDTCVNDRCKELRDYVDCNYDGEQEKCDKELHVQNKRVVFIKNQTEVNNWREGNRCTRDDKSNIVFKYLDGNNSTEIWIQREKELPPEINKWMAAGTSIGVILLIGILTLIAWKILVDIHDSREYRKFVEESKAAGFEVSENPLYNPPATSISNPAYTGQG